MTSTEPRIASVGGRRPGALDARLVASALFGLSTVTVVVAALVGFAAEGWHGFGWETAAAAGTAVATALLAAFTAALAFTTSGDVRATWELAELTRRDQAERQRPLVLEHSTRYQGDYRDGYVDVKLSNAGLGPALRILLEISYPVGDREFRWDAMQPVLGPSATVEVRVATPFPVPLNVNPDGFSVRGSYVDRSQDVAYAIINRDWEEADP